IVAFGATQVLGQDQQSAAPSPDHPLRIVPGNRAEPTDLDSAALAPQRDATAAPTTDAASDRTDGTTTSSAAATKSNPGTRTNAGAQGGATAPKTVAPTTTNA